MIEWLKIGFIFPWIRCSFHVIIQTFYGLSRNQLFRFNHAWWILLFALFLWRLKVILIIVILVISCFVFGFIFGDFRLLLLLLLINLIEIIINYIIKVVIIDSTSSFFVSVIWYFWLVFLSILLFLH